MSAAKTSAKQVANKVALYAVENGDNYPTMLDEIDVADDGGTSYLYRVNNNISPKTWCVTVTVSNKSAHASSMQASPVEVEPGATYLLQTGNTAYTW